MILKMKGSRVGVQEKLLEQSLYFGKSKGKGQDFTSAFAWEIR